MGSQLPLPDDSNSERLSLALESEVAGLYSCETAKEACSSVQNMVIDIGGGTVDITVFTAEDGGIVINNIPTGYFWGGTLVNETFIKMLQDTVGDPNFSKFLHSSQQAALLNRVFYSEFEEQKILFGQVKTDIIGINLNRFADVYCIELTTGFEQMSDTDYEDNTLYIEKKLVESKFFNPAIDEVIQCILSIIEKHNLYTSTSTIYLVGGFGGCKYVRHKVRTAIENLQQSKGLTCQVVSPPYPSIAVAQGAVMWRKDPTKVKARRADATYGISTQVPFEDGKHDQQYKIFNEVNKKPLCKSVFQVFVEKNEIIHFNEAMSTIVYPENDSDTQLIVKIYSTLAANGHVPQYTEDNPAVTPIGQLIIDISNSAGLPKEKRGVEVIIDFSGTEIRTKAKYSQTGEGLKIVCDFL